MTLGTLFIISAPSGAGKTAWFELLNRLDNLQVSVSHTTRPSRSGEKDGIDYHFVSHQQFETMVEQHSSLSMLRFTTTTMVHPKNGFKAS